MMRSLFSGVSGLKAHQSRMDVIGNNIANVNTTGFKSSRTTFADTLSQTQSGASKATDVRGGINPKQVGLGVGVSSIDLIFTDASPTATGKNTDLALTGNGLFVVGQGTNTYYTRNGAFEFDESGNYVLPGSGYFVKGWMGDEEGNINTTNAVTNITIPAGQTMPAKSTTLANFDGNLKSNTLLIQSITKGTRMETNPGTAMSASTSDPVTIRLSDGNELQVTSGLYTVGHSMPITTTYTAYDSLGNQHTIPLVFEKVGAMSVSTKNLQTGNTTLNGTGSIWQYSIPDFVPTGTVTAVSGLSRAIKETDGTIVIPSFVYDTAMTVGSTQQAANTYQTMGFIAFDEQGSLIPAATGGSTVTFASNGTGKQYTLTSSNTMHLTYFSSEEDYRNVNAGTYNVNAQAKKTDYEHVASNGAYAGQVSLNYSQVTQIAGGDSIYANPNGYAAGKLQSVNVDASGVITGNYTNGERRAEAQVAIAQFNNPSGLTKVGNSLYQVSNNSGAANIKSADALGVSITPAALEMSNVDVANEFSDMIITQRGFQSNSKMVTVGDEMLETVINMKR